MTGDNINDQSDMTPERKEMLRRKYINPPNTLENAGIIAEAEQLERAVRDTHQACEQYNTSQEIQWLTWDMPQPLRDFVANYAARLREAARRDSQTSWRAEHLGTEFDPMVLYFAGWEGSDELPDYNPDNPRHTNVPLGHIVCEPNVVHVLRPAGGPVEDDDGDIDAGPQPPHYDFAAFFDLAERLRADRGWPCDLVLAGRCATRLQHAAIPMGRDIYMTAICHACLAKLEREFKATHPDWVVPKGRRNPFAAAVKRTPPYFGG